MTKIYATNTEYFIDLFFRDPDSPTKHNSESNETSKIGANQISNGYSHTELTEKQQVKEESPIYNYPTRKGTTVSKVSNSIEVFGYNFCNNKYTKNNTNIIMNISEHKNVIYSGRCSRCCRQTQPLLRHLQESL